MKRIILAICLAITGWGGTELVAQPVMAATLCVGSGPGCYSTIQAALNAAHDGDVIRVGPGTFPGGIAIDKSVSLVGAGPAATTISGGGPVLTIGQFGAATKPIVSLAGLTVRGGLNTSSPTTVVAVGGGIQVAPGATVTVSGSLITGNRAAPTSTVPSGVATCPGNVSCPFARAGGRGIGSWGTLTLTNTTVTANAVGSAAGIASDAEGGGIFANSGGSLTLVDSRVTDNQAISTAPDGRFASGGGIFTNPGVPLTVRDSVIDTNSATLSSTLPSSVAEQSGMVADGGAIHHSDNGMVTIVNSELNGNEVSVTDLNGEPLAIDAAMNPGVFTSVVIRDSTINNNRLTATVGSSADVGPSGDTLEFDAFATISDTRIMGNSSSIVSPTGSAGVTGAIAAFDTASQPALITDSVISNNTLRAASFSGTATVQGAAIINNGLLVLRNDLISGNSGVATAPAGFAQGGGIYNGPLFFTAPVQLTLENTIVTHNTLTASPGLSVQGGGLFTPGFSVTLRDSEIAGNVPDQCFGVAC